jgi:hypothetical protein
VVDNAAGGIFLNTPLQIDTVMNCILWTNGPYDIGGNAASVTYSDVQQASVGTGNITSDPMFVGASAGDYHLLPNSPCIDAGDPASPHDPDGTRSDMGAHFFDQNAVGVDGPEAGSVPAVFSLSQNYPNPFNPTTTIRYTLPERSRVELAVFNILGQQVVDLVQGEQEGGYYEAVFDASALASGVYLYTLHAGSLVLVRRLIVLK